MGDMGDMEIAVLYGRDHTELGVVASGQVGGRAGFALSRGKYPKAYPYVDANEDALLVASDGRAWLLVVADGHSGVAASHAAIEALADEASELLGDPDPLHMAAEALTLAHAAVLPVERTPGEYPSRTALTVAVVTGGHAAVAGAGDTTAFHVRGGRARRLLERTPFLGPGVPARILTPPRPLRLDEGRLVVCSDGLVDFLGRHPEETLVPAVAAPDPEGAATGTMEAAFRGAAGDNVAVVVFNAAG